MGQFTMYYMVDTLRNPLQLDRGIKPESLLKEIHSFEGKLAEYITNFSGSMFFVYVHTVWFGLWIAVNHGFFEPILHPFDPFPYGLLTMIVSLEAIYLSTFIMINQNRQALVDTYRVLEEEKEQREEEEQQEELEEEVEDIQKDLDHIKAAISMLQNKLNQKHYTNPSGNGGGKSSPSGEPLL